MNNETVIFEQIKCPENKSPIFFINLTADIFKGNSKKPTTRKVKGLVAKGTKDQIKNSPDTKLRFLRDLFGMKKANAFDLDKVKITDIEIVRSLGYGVK